MAEKLDQNKVARWYKCGLWSAEMVDEAVADGALTEEQAREIKGEDAGA